MRSALLTASALIITAMLACAQGTDPNATGDLGGGGDGTSADGGGSSVPPDTSNNGYTAPNYDGGTTKSHDAGGATKPTPEGGTTMTMDAGSTTQKDSGTTMMMGGGDTCTGTTSSQLTKKGKPETYDDVCDGYWLTDFTDTGNPCTPGGNDCAALNGEQGFSPFCCFVPPPGSLCDLDYNSTPQCVPQ
jgi:hypothetical protein